MMTTSWDNRLSTNGDLDVMANGVKSLEPRRKGTQFESVMCEVNHVWLVFIDQTVRIAIKPNRVCAVPTDDTN